MPSQSTNKRTRSTNSASMKQSTLGFTSLKRTASGASANSDLKRRAPLRTKSAPITVVEDIESDSDQDAYEKEVDFLEMSSGEDEDPVAGLKRRHQVAATHLLDIDLRAENPGRWNKAYGAARAENGNLPTIHTEHENKVNAILRSFDLTYNFGPCIGIPRIARWDRAQANGLNPPPEVREILMTKQGFEEDEYRKSCLDGLV